MAEFIVNTEATVAAQVTPAMSQSNSARYAAGQTLNQTIVLRAGQNYSPNIGFQNIVIESSGPVQLIAAKGSNAVFINQVVNQQTTIDDTVDSFSIANNGTAVVTVKMTVSLYDGTPLPATSVVTSVNGKTGDVILSTVNENSATGTSLISDSGSTTGIVKLKTLVAGSGIAITSDANGNLSIASQVSQNPFYQMAFAYSGSDLVNSSVGTIIGRHCVAVKSLLSSDFVGCAASLSAQTASGQSMTIQIGYYSASTNASSNIGSITYSAGSAIGAFVPTQTGVSYQLSPGDVITLTVQAITTSGNFATPVATLVSTPNA